MKQYSLKIASKNEKSLKNFLFFFSNHLKNKFNIIQKLVTAHKNKKTITLLKSPHVNKTAQEQFEIRVFTKQVIIKSFFLEKNIIFLKKILNNFFQDISISIEYLADKNINLKNKLWIFYPDNFKLPISRKSKVNFKRNKKKKKSKAINLKKKFLSNLAKFLKIISIFGKIVIINHLSLSSTCRLVKNIEPKCLNSSAVEQRTENP